MRTVSPHKKMKTVYTNKGKDLYKLDLHDHAIIAQKVDDLSQDAKWETWKDHPVWLYPSRIIDYVLENGIVVFREEEIKRFESVKEEEGTRENMMRKAVHSSITERKYYNFVRIEELLPGAQKILFAGGSIGIVGDGFVAVYEPTY